MKVVKRALIGLVFLAAGCNNATHREMDEHTGCGEDEQYRLLEDGEATVVIDDAQAPQMTDPADGATVPFSPKVIVRWNQSPSSPGQNDGDVPYMNGVNGCNDCCPQFTPGALSTLHEPPESGDIYDLQFTVNGSYVWRLITTLQEWTPTDDLWATWQGKHVSLKIYRMAILQNNPKSGPFVAMQPFTFTVGN
jgi:hypothetical protein